MKNLLIVSPRFPPADAPDHHRVRMLLPFLRCHAWKAVVLCVDSEFVEGAADANLLRTVPESVEVVRCRAIPAAWSRPFGIGSLSLRAGLYLRFAGDRLLRERSFDLVFFSTTEFPVFTLGPRWHRKFGVPFVLDLQDPWVNPYYRDYRVRPPGGSLKHALHQVAARHLEGRVIAEASHIIAVSPHYPSTLIKRYPTMRPSRFSTIPFAGARRDFEIAAGDASIQPLFSRDDGRRHWVYAGAVSPGMSKALIAFFQAFRRAIDSGLIEPDSILLHFIGTDYAPAGRARERVVPLAEMSGVGDSVRERVERLPYLSALKSLLNADALLIFGSDDAAYTASKLFTYILARKPLLTIFHEQSSVTALMRDMNAGVAVTFREEMTPADLANLVFDRWFEHKAFEVAPKGERDLIHPHTDEAVARQLAGIFDVAVRRSSFIPPGAANNV